MPTAKPASPRRVFLGWERACLESACAFLVGLYGEGGAVDMGGTRGPLVVVPGGRARRVLLSLLAEACDASSLMMIPPMSVTPGEIGELLLTHDGRVASRQVRRLAWIEALRSGEQTLAETIVSRRPEHEDLVRWSALGAMLERCHDELAGELLLFEDVPARAASMVDFPDERRWEALAEIQRDYGRVLQEWGVFDPAMIRLQSVRNNEAVVDRDVVLVGVPELNSATRTILGRTAGSITSLVFAPESMSERFDEFGCVRVEAWSEGVIDLEESQILVSEGPDDQADAALEAIAALGGRFATDEVVIGVPDKSIVPYLRQRAERYGGVEVRYAGGTPVSRTPVYRLLRSAASYLESGTFEAFAALVRHPDVESRIERKIALAGRQGWWIDELDEYLRDHVQARADGVWQDCHPTRLGALRGAHRVVLELLAPLSPERTGSAASRRPITEWMEPLLDVLSRVYGGVERNRFGGDRLLVESCLAVRDAARALACHADGAIQMRSTPAQAIRLVLEQIGSGEIPERPSDETIELLGWLELALDPAPVVVVTGMNEGSIPSTVVGDALLPDGLRRVLGVTDDQQRLARDAFLLSAIVASRPHARVVVGRQNPEGDPLKPSRLLLRCDEQTAAARFARLTSEGRDDHRTLELISHLRCGEVSLYRPAPIVNREPLESMSVTSFRTYLSSPYLFYLRYVLRTKDRNDQSREMDGAAFGSLIHDVLEAFGQGDARESTDRRRIDESLMDQLDGIAHRRFGASPTPAIAIQVELARFRLREFAHKQAAWAQEGWQIVASEWRPAQKRAPFEVDGELIWLSGKIDRIDRNSNTGQLAILDYKTGESVSSPESAHVGRDGWRDLQLPLYRHLAAEFGGTDGAMLGYVTLPKKQGGVEFQSATWGSAELNVADDVARDVVRAVRRGEFGEIGDPWISSDAVGALCGVGLIASADGGSEE